MARPRPLADRELLGRALTVDPGREEALIIAGAA